LAEYGSGDRTGKESVRTLGVRTVVMPAGGGEPHFREYVNDDTGGIHPGAHGREGAEVVAEIELDVSDGKLSEVDKQRLVRNFLVAARQVWQKRLNCTAGSKNVQEQGIKPKHAPKRARPMGEISKEQQTKPKRAAKSAAPVGEVCPRKCEDIHQKAVPPGRGLYDMSIYIDRDEQETITGTETRMPAWSEQNGVTNRCYIAGAIRPWRDGYKIDSDVGAMAQEHVPPIVRSRQNRLKREAMYGRRLVDYRTCACCGTGTHRIYTDQNVTAPKQQLIVSDHRDHLGSAGSMQLDVHASRAGAMPIRWLRRQYNILSEVGRKLRPGRTRTKQHESAAITNLLIARAEMVNVYHMKQSCGVIANMRAGGDKTMCMMQLRPGKLGSTVWYSNDQLASQGVAVRSLKRETSADSAYKATVAMPCYPSVTKVQVNTIGCDATKEIHRAAVFGDGAYIWECRVASVCGKVVQHPDIPVHCVERICMNVAAMFAHRPKILMWCMCSSRRSGPCMTRPFEIYMSGRWVSPVRQVNAQLEQWVQTADTKQIPCHKSVKAPKLWQCRVQGQAKQAATQASGLHKQVMESAMKRYPPAGRIVH